MSIFPKIKFRVPEASLRIFYNFEYGDIEHYEKHSHPQVVDSVLEMAQRIRYIKKMVPKLNHLDVQKVGSVSKEQIIEEYKKAVVFPFTCYPAVWTEGFSISSAEALCHGAVTILSDSDALP